MQIPQSFARGVISQTFADEHSLPAVTADLRKQVAEDAKMLLKMPFHVRCAIWRSTFTMLNAMRRPLGLGLYYAVQGSSRRAIKKNKFNAVSIAKCDAVNLISMGLNSKAMALRLGVSQPTLRRMLRSLNLFQPAADAQVHAAVEQHVKLFPHSGCKLVGAFLRIRYPQWRVRRRQIRSALSTLRVQQVPSSLRDISRQRPARLRANAVWHMDSYCKLAFAGLWVHMAVDRHSKVVTMCVVSPRNTACATLQAFVYGTEHFRVPQCVCVDSGAENGLLTAVKSAGLSVEVGLTAAENSPVERRWQDVKTLNLVRGYLLRLASKPVRGAVEQWARRCAVWLTYGTLLQRLLSTEQLRWNVHACSELPHGHSPFMAWADSMHQQRHRTELLEAACPEQLLLHDLSSWSAGEIFNSLADLSNTVQEADCLERARANANCAARIATFVGQVDGVVASDCVWASLETLQEHLQHELWISQR